MVDNDCDDNHEVRSQHRSTLPSLAELLEEEEHEASARRRRVRRKREVDSVSKLRRSSQLAAKEEPCYVDATSKATRVKAAKLELNKT